MSKRLRILHWPTSYPDPEYGQPYAMIFVAEHVRAAALYHENVVLYKSPNPLIKGRFLQEVARSTEQGIFTIRIHTRRGSEWANRLLTYWGMGTQVLRLLMSGFRPDVIHIHVFSEARMALVLAHLLNIPVVTTEHWSALCLTDSLSANRLAFARRVYEQSAMVLPVCEHLRNCIQINTGARFQYQIVFNAVDARIFFFEQHEIFRQILVVARIETPKDFPTILRAIALLKAKDVVLKVVGRGDATALLDFASELGILNRVMFVGEQPKKRIAELMRESAVLAVSSLWENSPCVIGEAMCCGLPVVATNVGGIPELIDPQTGRLVPVCDAEEMASSLEEVLEHPQLFDRQDIALKAQKKFSYEAIGIQLDQVYHEVTSAH